MTLLIFANVSACSNSNAAPRNLNMVVSVSTDGHYAIATNTNKQAVLWNLQNHSYQIIFNDANIYSAYFIKNTHDFMYQNDATNEVVIENVDGHLIKNFNPHFPTYGQAITSNLHYWFASDLGQDLYRFDLHSQKLLLFNNSCFPDQAPAPMGKTGCYPLEAMGQLFAITFTPDQKDIVATTNGGFYVWNIESGEMTADVSGNDAQTVAAINLDGHYLVTGDIMNGGIKYNLIKHTSALFLYSTLFSKEQTHNFGQGSFEIFAIKFIANNELLVINHGYPNLFNYATLYNVNDLRISKMYLKLVQENSTKDHKGWIKYTLPSSKYLPLIPNASTDFNYQNTWPLTSDQFSRDQAIDTSPSAHILVMAMDRANGIIVYHYDPKTQTLTREWAGVVNSWWHL